MIDWILATIQKPIGLLSIWDLIRLIPVFWLAFLICFVGFHVLKVLFSKPE